MKSPKIYCITAIAGIFILAFASTQSFAQLSGTKNIPGDYSTLAAAIADLNVQGLGSGVTLNVLAGNPQRAPQGGYVIGGTGSAILSGANATGLNKQVYISGNGNTVTADSLQAGGSLTDAVFKLIGADYITIQDFIINENPANTISTAVNNNMTEWGIALLYANNTDGAKNNTIQNNIISLNRTYANSFGIYSNVEHTATNVTQTYPLGAASGSNSDLHIYDNHVSNVNTGIAVIGSEIDQCADKGLIIGGSAFNANTVSDFGSSGTFSAFASVAQNVCGIVVNNQLNCVISYNSVTSSAGGTTSGTLRGIYSHLYGNLPTGNFYLYINFNSIALHSGNAAGDMTGIANETGSDGIDLTINNNDVHELQYSSNGSGIATAIENSADTYAQQISNNTFSNLVINTTGEVNLLRIKGVPSVPFGGKLVRNNSINGSVSKTLPGGYFFCVNELYSILMDASTYTTIDSNNFSNISVTGNTYFSGFMCGQNYSASLFPTNVLRANTLQNVSCGTVYNNGINAFYYKTEKNSIVNFTGKGPMTGIDCGNDDVVTGNLISGLACDSDNLVIGILSENPDGLKISANKIFDLSNTDAAGLVSGIYIRSDITTACVVNIYNNMIGDLRTPNAINIDAVTGIVLTNIFSNGGTLTGNIDFNTIWLDATSTSSTTFGASIIFADGSIQQPPTVHAKNNIFVNTSVAGPSGGFNTAIKYVTYVAGSYWGNNNCYYVGTAAANQLIFGAGFQNNPSISMLTVPDFSTYLLSGAETSSITENPPFLSTTGTSPQFLHIDSTVVTQIESGGSLLSGIYIDFDNEKRFGAAGYTGYGTAPDIGADECWNLPLAINDKPSLQECSVYPNPATKKFFVKNAAGKISFIELLDLAGKVLKVIDAKRGKNGEASEIEIDQLKSGLYFLRIGYENAPDAYKSIAVYE